MLKKTGVVVAVVGMIALSAFLASCGSSSSRPSGLLYVVSQSQANVSSFAVNLANGELSLINSNLAATCAATSGGCGLPLGISLDPTGATAFVLNQNTLSGYTVGSDGSLAAPTEAATFPAGQTARAMSPTAGGDFLFVISVGAASPTDCPGAGGAYGADCPLISIFSTKTGSAAASLVSSVPLSRIPTAVSVLTFSFPGSSAQTLLFVTSNLDLTANHNDNLLSVYSVDSSGNLTEQTSSPYPTLVNPLSVLAVNTNPPDQNTGGVFVYVGSQGATSGSVSAFEVCTQVGNGCSPQDVSDEAVVSIGSPTTVGQNPIAMLPDPTFNFLYVACAVGNNVYAFRMTTGTGILTPLAPPLEPTGLEPVALAIHASNNTTNEYLYVSNNAASTISGYTVNVTSGALSSPMAPLIFTPGNPYGMVGK